MTVPPASPGGAGGGGGPGAAPRVPAAVDEDAARRQHRLLLQRCDLLYQDNQRLLHRIYQVKRLTKRYKKEIKFLTNRLDMHGDGFRTVKMEEDVKPSSSTFHHGKFNSNAKTSAAGKATNSDKNTPKKTPAKKKHPKPRSTSNFDIRKKF